MIISEYTLLEDAFEAAFPFMLNRLSDVGIIKGDPHSAELCFARDEACERCFTEFITALEEIGVELENAKVVPDGKR